MLTSNVSIVLDECDKLYEQYKKHVIDDDGKENIQVLTQHPLVEILTDPANTIDHVMGLSATIGRGGAEHELARQSSSLNQSMVTG